MKHNLSLQVAASLVVLFSLAVAVLHGAITVNGVGDEDIETDRASFEVPSEVGFTIVVELNGDPIALDTNYEVLTPGYYELSVTKTENGTGTEESVIIQFIVRDSERGSSETGLLNWVPYPTIDSAPEAINQGTLEVIVPPAVPAGMPIPMIAWLHDGADKAIRLNGTVWTPERPDSRFRVLRGVGSGTLPGVVAAGTLEVTPTLGGLTDPKSIQVEPAPAWAIVDSDIATSAAWAANSRIHVTGDITVDAGVTLTIGAGSIVQLAPDVQIDLDGRLVVNGTRAAPVLFAPEPGAGSWGGFFARSATAEVSATGAIFTGSGADENWFDPPGFNFSTHRDEQATFAFNDCTGSFTDCYFFDLAGQALHGNDATIKLTRCLVQRAISAGQFNGGKVTVRESALIEFPVNDGNFSDNDDDGIYFTEGSHELVDSLIGWAKDDGVDAGSGDQGDVVVTRCWFEACFHEAMAWSGEVRDADVFDSVAINSGQGIEAGWSGGNQGAPGNDPSPEVTVRGSLCIGNHVGLRYGDNYDWDYWGQLNVSESISIHNHRDVWGFEWDSWNYRDERMDLQNNLVSKVDTRHPGNSEWDAELNGPLLTPFMPTAVTTVGAGIQSWEFQKDIAHYGEPVAIGLSEFTSAAVSLDYEIAGQNLDGAQVILDSGTIAFGAGEIRHHLTPPDLGETEYALVRVTVLNPSGCVIATARNLVYLSPGASSDEPDTLSRKSHREKTLGVANS
jgi:hypothetical protein